MEFFLTGGTGLLGTYFLIQALEQGHGVTAIYRNEKSIELSKKIFALQGTQIVEKFSKIHWVQARENHRFSCFAWCLIET